MIFETVFSDKYYIYISYFAYHTTRKVTTRKVSMLEFCLHPPPRLPSCLRHSSLPALPCPFLSPNLPNQKANLNFNDNITGNETKTSSETKQFPL